MIFFRPVTLFGDQNTAGLHRRTDRQGLAQADRTVFQAAAERNGLGAGVADI